MFFRADPTVRPFCMSHPAATENVDMTDLTTSPFQTSTTTAKPSNWLDRIRKAVPGWKSCGRIVVTGGLLMFIGLTVYTLVLIIAPAPTTLNMIGTRLSGTSLDRTIIPVSQISPNLIRAVIAAEDTRFCEHAGIDFSAISAAFEHNQTSKRRRGGSTISQQTAKNIFFWNGGGYVRKAGEAGMTLMIETLWSKRRIMEQYLNIAEWGDGIYGAEAAARARFGKSASQLTVREAALLASVLPNPNKWRLDPAGAYISGRASTISQRMGIVKRDGLDDCVLP